MNAPFPMPAPRPVSLTSRQAAVLRYIHGYQLHHGGVSPSLNEIAADLKLGSKGSLCGVLLALEERGHIRRRAGQARAIEILHRPCIPMANGAPLYFVPVPGGRDA